MLIFYAKHVPHLISEILIITRDIINVYTIWNHKYLVTWQSIPAYKILLKGLRGNSEGFYVFISHAHYLNYPRQVN
ncbi:hypothetical protein CF15_08290 [Pyrodictium occultum]|uniref:Uncharacterized protein n=1 Tax=Pyrodictium occultum TaxID=2309 RepID=A0A0V8RRT7_PYROC|nr:hypothetical protein CF15_08290 [Pyrodictium occultum]